MLPALDNSLEGAEVSGDYALRIRHILICRAVWRHFPVWTRRASVRLHYLKRDKMQPGRERSGHIGRISAKGARFKMPVNAAMFLFLAAAVVAVFAFLSIAVWVNGPTHERLARERLALLRSIAESQSANAMEVLAMLRREDERRAARKARQERQGWIAGGLIVIAVGVGLGIMLIVLDTKGGNTWSIAAIPLLVGCVLLGVGLRENPDREIQ